MDVFDLGIEPLVLIARCARTAGLRADLAERAVLSRSIGPYPLLGAGLGGGQPAAPRESVRRLG